jgi:precorrin-6A synthase
LAGHRKPCRSTAPASGRLDRLAAIGQETPMRKILVVGIGAGNPEHLTVQAVNALNRADVLFIPDKGERKSGLAALRREICDHFVTNPASRQVEFDVPARARPTDSYRRTVDDWHAAIAQIYERLILDEIGEDGCGAFLIWGDPSLYDSALRILERVAERGTVEFSLEVVPGITAIQALAAGHRMALNRIGDPFLVTTGRRLAEDGMPDNAGTAVVLLDGQQAFLSVADKGATIHWGAYLGTKDEILLSGRLGDVEDEIVRARDEARQRHGWIMDTYLLRKTGD